MAFKASPTAKKGLFNIHGIEEFVEKFIERKLKEARVDERISELRKALRLDKKGGAKAAAVSAPVVAAAVPAPKASAPKAVEAAVPAPKASKPAVVAEAKPAKVAKAAAKKPKAPSKAKATVAAAATDGADPLEALLSALEAHPKKASLVKAGKQKDQLLRSLIPLYVGQKLDVEVSSGTTSKFWSKHGITYAAPNAAKALREHSGFAKRTAKGVQITAAGVKYVDDALKA